MKTLGGFLQKLQTIIPREVKVKMVIIECISGIYNIQVSKKEGLRIQCNTTMSITD